MALPINIEDLLNKNKVESDRIEFKKGWNPVSPCHPDFVKNVLVDVQVECVDLQCVAMKISQLCPSSGPVVSQSDIEKLAQCLLRATTEVSGHDMLDGIDTTSYKQRKRKYLDQLITMGLVEMTKPDKPTASDQKYRCTTLGKQMIMGDRTIKS